MTKLASSPKQFRLLPDFINTRIIIICLPVTAVSFSWTCSSQLFCDKVLIKENMWPSGKKRPRQVGKCFGKFFKALLCALSGEKKNIIFKVSS